MIKEVRWVGLLLVIVVYGGGPAGCSRKPAYSDMDTNRASRNENQNQSRNQSTEGQATATPPVPLPAPDPAAPAPVPTPAGTTIKSPTFLDQSTSGIKDLPSYPGAYRVSVQLGPLQGFNTMSLGYTTSDPMTKITAFYERVIKDHKWTVIDKLVDPEFSEWNLKKGEENTAKVQVKRDQQTGVFAIVIVRAEKEGAPNK